MTDECYIWFFQQQYNFIDREFFEVTMKTQRRACLKTDKSGNASEDKLWWLPSICILLSLISFVTLFNYFFSMSKHLAKLQKAYDKRVQQ